MPRAMRTKFRATVVGIVTVGATLVFPIASANAAKVCTGFLGDTACWHEYVGKTWVSGSRCVLFAESYGFSAAQIQCHAEPPDGNYHFWGYYPDCPVGATLQKCETA